MTFFDNLAVVIS